MTALQDMTALEAQYEREIEEKLAARRDAEAAVEEAMEAFVQKVKEAKLHGVSVPTLANWLEMSRDGVYKLMDRYE